MVGSHEFLPIERGPPRIGKSLPALSLFVERLALRGLLSDDDKEAIIALPVQEISARANSDVIRPAEPNTHMYVVADGLLARYGQMKDGQRQIVALHIVGDMADPDALTARQPSFGLQALAPSRIIRIPHEPLRALVRRHPRIGQSLWAEGAADAAILSHWLVSIGGRNAKARLAHLYCEMAIRYRQAGLGSSFGFEFPITQNHLGDALSLSTVHVNRTLKELRNEGIVDVHGGAVNVLDWKGLCDVAEFDSAYLEVSPSLIA